MPDEIVPQDSRVSVQVNNGGQQFTPRGNPQVSEADPQSIQASLRSPSGSRLVGDVTDDCRVTVGGVEMTIAQARQHGLIAVTDGQVSEAEHPEPVEPEAGPDDALDVDAETVDTLNNWAGAIAEYTGSHQNTYSVVSEFMSNPEQLPPLLSTLAEEQGQDPGAFHAEAKKMASDIEGALHDRVRSLGVDPAEFGAFIRSSAKADDLNRAIVHLVVTGEFEPMNTLLDYYRRAAPTKDDPNAPVSVEVNGQRIETTVANARRQGWL